MRKSVCLIVCFYLFMACSKNVLSNVKELVDGDPTTYFKGNSGVNKIIFDANSGEPILSYKLYSSGLNPFHDPVKWTLKASNNGKKWTIVDKRENQKFCSRFQEILCTVESPGNYKQYMLEVEASKGDTLAIADVLFFEENLFKKWKDFSFPEVKFKDLAVQTEGSKIYAQLVQNPDEYVKYHTQKVAEILFFTAKDTMNDVRTIEYTLQDYEGISSKSGAPPVISIQYSTQHIEKSARESLYKLDYETRGVLYHELVHAYQFEPKGIGTYSTNKTFWASIEGLADAVRAEAGLFDIKNMRKPGGNWMDGYKTTGFFIQWLKTKDPDAIRKFHLTVRDLDVWSFDAAIKAMFGDNNSIESVWNEYQEYLKTLE